jgi:hypothetical protein
MLETLQKAIPEDRKHDAVTYVIGLPLVFVGWANENPDVLAAWGTFLASVILGLRFSVDMGIRLYRWWKSRDDS